MPQHTRPRSASLSQRLLTLLITDDPHQRVRLTMTGMAALLMLCCIAVVQLVTVEAPSLFAWVQGWSLVCSIGLVVVYALIRSGFSQRWRDPAMTLFQILASLFGAAVAYVIAGPARDIVLPIVAVILVFGSFGLTRQQMLFVLVYGMAAFALAVAAVQWWPGAGGQTPLESLATMVMVVVVMASSTLLNIRISAAREKLRQQKLSVERERDLAMRDALTGLPNRRFMQDIMGWEGGRIQRSGRNELPLLIAQLDLDHFKTINDTLGHEEGDKHLRQIARRLTVAVADQGLVARLGGDEFVVLAQQLNADEVQAHAQARALAERVLTALATPTQLAGRLMHTSASLGVCLFRPGASTTKELLKRADTAMYQAKSVGRNGYRFFDPVLQSQLEARAALETALHGAIEARQLALHYQVQVNALGQPVGVEALLRWRHPLHGQVPPAQFIPIAEASDLILTLGDWVLQQACAQLQAWAGQPHTRGLTISVNVSARQLAQPGFVDQVHGALAGTGARPELLVLELTESAMLQDIADTVRKMQALRCLGVRFALDDFGTGYSCLSQLQRLPLYQLKIDRSFIQDMGARASNAVIVQTIVGMARTLGLHIVAEGVETEAQRGVLARLKCPAFQGYLFGMPQSAEALETWLRDQCPASEASSLLQSEPDDVQIFERQT